MLTQTIPQMEMIPVTNPPDAINRKDYSKTIGAKVSKADYQAFTLAARETRLTPSELNRKLIHEYLAKGAPESAGQTPPAREGSPSAPAKEQSVQRRKAFGSRLVFPLYFPTPIKVHPHAARQR